MGPEVEAAAVEGEMPPQAPDPLPVVFVAAFVGEAVGADVGLGQADVAGLEVVVADDGEIADAVDAFAADDALREHQIQRHVLSADEEALDPEAGPLAAGEARVGFDLDLGRRLARHHENILAAIAGELRAIEGGFGADGVDGEARLADEQGAADEQAAQSRAPGEPREHHDRREQARVIRRRQNRAEQRHQAPAREAADRKVEARQRADEQPAARFVLADLVAVKTFERRRGRILFVLELLDDRAQPVDVRAKRLLVPSASRLDAFVRIAGAAMKVRMAKGFSSGIAL